MISQAHADFWAGYNSLPEEFNDWRGRNSVSGSKTLFNAALHFKPLIGDVWSVRVNQNYRALGRRRDNLIVWFWIGIHAEYDQLLKRL